MTIISPDSQLRYAVRANNAKISQCFFGLLSRVRASAFASGRHTLNFWSRMLPKSCQLLGWMLISPSKGIADHAIHLLVQRGDTKVYRFMGMGASCWAFLILEPFFSRRKKFSVSKAVVCDAMHSESEKKERRERQRENKRLSHSPLVLLVMISELS